ncbi:sulfatase, partial [Verrucomicrobiota bacterium]
MSGQNEQRLNVLQIIADEHQAAVTGYEGHPQVKTPNLDRLAAAGVRFSRCYTQNTICTPSRTSILSGQYCHNHGYYGLHGPRPDALPSFFSHFKSHGYRTAGIGQLHTPNSPRNWLESHLDLFADSFYSVDGVDGQTPWYEELESLRLTEKNEFYQSRAGLAKDKHSERPSELAFEHSQEGWCVREAMRFMDESGDEPFCIQVSMERPHDPCVPAREFWDMYPDDIELPETFKDDCSHRPPHFREMHEGWREQTGDDYLNAAKRRWKGYLGSVTHTDHGVGQLLDYLEQKGLAENTIVIYSVDHGGYMACYGIYEKAPGISSEAICRVPYLWRVPGMTPAGHVCDELVENIDIAPTITALCGLPPMTSADGKDISGLLSGNDEPVREIAVTECPHSK